MSLQDEIDAIAYPPTHTYELDGLVPTGQLAARVEVIEEEFPNFFKSGYGLLDVGCNKGFFSLYQKGSVVGIDTSKECIELCIKLSNETCDLYRKYHVVSFGDFKVSCKFLRIFIGNGHHYPFIEAGGWGWVEKLGNLTAVGGQVLLEGPTGMESVDAQNCIPLELVGEFTQEKLLAAFEPLFILRKLVPSPLVDRYFLLFEKRTAEDIYENYLKTIYQLAGDYVISTDVIMEICTRHDRGIFGRAIIPHREYLFVDKSPQRPGLSLDAVRDFLPPCDVVISTAILHHTAPEEIETLFKNIAKNTRRTIIFSGPADDMGVPLYGDHTYHLNVEELGKIAERAGWKMVVQERIGLKYATPYEWFLVFRRLP